jgi:hypothetical protein
VFTIIRQSLTLLKTATKTGAYDYYPPLLTKQMANIKVV